MSPLKQQGFPQTLTEALKFIMMGPRLPFGMMCDVISCLQHDTHELPHIKGVVGKLRMVPKGRMMTLKNKVWKKKHKKEEQLGKCSAPNKQCIWVQRASAVFLSSRRLVREFSYLVLWDHFVHFLPSHILNAPQTSQISIAALILTVISEKDRCRHSSLNFFSLPLNLPLHLPFFSTAWLLLCVPTVLRSFVAFMKSHTKPCHIPVSCPAKACQVWWTPD